MSNQPNGIPAQSANPLAKHFRQPAIQLKLPSQGRYYPEGTLNLPVTGAIPVYPMTVKDELTLKTPDALLNGSGMVEVVKSCCPNILDPWQMPAVDVDAVFVAIRLASYGAGMDFSSKCPHCGTENEHKVDLRVVLDRLHPANYSQPKTIDNLKFKFKPQSYQNINKTGIITFEEQRLVDSVIQNQTLSDEEKTAKFNASFEKLKEMNIDVIAVSIESITTEDDTIVNDYGMIKEFLNNCGRNVYDEIKNQIQALTDQNKLDDLQLNCDECTKEYSTGLIFDQSNFFD